VQKGELECIAAGHNCTGFISRKVLISIWRSKVMISQIQEPEEEFALFEHVKYVTGVKLL